MNVVAYIRVSTDGQVGENKFGLESQKQIITEYCNANNLNILKWYMDEGESGAKERPGFDEIIYGDVSNPPYEAVIVAKSDRVARDINIYYYYKMMLIKKNIKLISIAEDFGQFGVFAGMLEAFTLCVAQMERDNITKRTSSGRRIKASKGGYSGGRPPYGYESVNGELVVVPEEAEIVRYVIEAKESGETFRGICAGLTRQGYRTRLGKEFQISTIQGILDNKKLYQGYYKYGSSQEWIKGQHEPIIEED